MLNIDQMFFTALLMNPWSTTKTPFKPGLYLSEKLSSTKWCSTSCERAVPQTSSASGGVASSSWPLPQRHHLNTDHQRSTAKLTTCSYRSVGALESTSSSPFKYHTNSHTRTHEAALCVGVFLTFTKRMRSRTRKYSPLVPQKRLFTLAGDAKPDLWKRLRII